MNPLLKPTYIRSLFEEHNFRPKKMWGQNFMISPHAIELIIRSSGLNKEDVVIEIGPGLGVLTRELLQKCKHVFSIECDPQLPELLKPHVELWENKFTLIQKDFLKVDLKSLYQEALKKKGEKGNVRIISNLPYSVTTPVFEHVIEANLPFDSMTVSVQTELAERVVAKPGKKDYGSLSVFIQFHAHPEITGKIKPTAFYPQPKIGSSVLHFHFYSDPPVEVKDKDLFFKVVRTSFGKRRKMLRNNLQDLPYTKEQINLALHQAGISEVRRPETLSLQEFAALTNSFKS